MIAAAMAGLHSAERTMCEICRSREATIELADDGWVCEACEKILPAERVQACADLLEHMRRVSNEREANEIAERLKMAIATQDWTYQFADSAAYHRGANAFDKLRALAARHSELTTDAETLEILNRFTPENVIDQCGSFSAKNLDDWRIAKRRGAIHV